MYPTNYRLAFIQCFLHMVVCFLPTARWSRWSKWRQLRGAWTEWSCSMDTQLAEIPIDGKVVEAMIYLSVENDPRRPWLHATSTPPSPYASHILNAPESVASLANASWTHQNAPERTGGRSNCTWRRRRWGCELAAPVPHGSLVLLYGNWLHNRRVHRGCDWRRARRGAWGREGKWDLEQ
jgi:hypothetical protein